MPDFGSPFDSFSRFDAFLGADPHGIGGGPDAFAARRQRILEVLLTGETGVQFEALALFAEPLFTLYELDPAEPFVLRTEPASVSDEVVALMEAARVLWAFFSLSPTTRGQRRQALAAQLIGDDADADVMVDLEGVIEATEVHWQALLPEEVEMAQETGHPTLAFDELLHHPAFRIEIDPDPAHAGYGEGALSETEARALFAQPLLEAPDVLLDPDAFDEALVRADVYWQAARRGTSAAAVARHLAEEGPGDVQEAERMLARYRELFPKHAS
ncbi:MAG: hypothetical protein AAF791_05355 [Bacteroidota bacterium]